MTKRQNRLAIVIPTKDRPDLLTRLLNSIKIQTESPDQIIIADGGDNPVDSVISQFPDMHISQVKVHPPGLTKQKNAGVAAIRPGIDLVAIFDDDIVLEPDTLKSMLTFWDGASDEIGGACFNVTNARPDNASFVKILKRIFFIDNREIGSVSRSGCITPIWDPRETQQVRWLGGGYTIWRIGLFKKWQFDEWFPANGLLEDVHFSYRAGKEYKLMVVAEAKVQHIEAPVPITDEVLRGKRQMTHWVYFVSNHDDLSMVMCLWSCVGRMAVNLATGILRREIGPILRTLGNIQGLGMVALAAVIPGRPRAKA